MGLHQDRDGRDFSKPIVTMCLGDDADFLIGGGKRTDTVRALRLRAGDVLIFSGESRIRFHGIRKIHAGSGPFPALGGHYGLTFHKAL